MEVNTALRERECVFMDGRAPEQLHRIIGVALAEISKQVNLVVAALNRMPEIGRRKMANELMGEMAERLRWAREATGGAS